ncbi:sigma-70 family RNA polymerase sigma factor [Sphingomonas naphthae]|uniref:Sigma-70 family RNA polymerase sigma factor n=1 Tax=Sphingomonas naphthae TaxID=1813468 RepID=A0ABY7TQG6_9SPHN|nr:sigma-70 family RNA polymerase sigma factor [Sphingomonas naphthae]WCT74414.1 sigma-70 family RNA polymerase sigma factor [Sphingomonas naphthae]
MVESVRERLDWFKAAILPHEGALRARLRRILPQGADVDDVVAETMTRAFANGEIGKTTTGRAYLFQIARNLLIDEARRNKIVSFEVLSDLDLLHADHSAEATLQARDELRHLQAIVDTLPQQCRRAFILRRVYDRSIGEIAEEMGLSVSTVDKHLTRAAAKIMQAIGQYEDFGFGWSLPKRGGTGSARAGGRSTLS